MTDSSELKMKNLAILTSRLDQVIDGVTKLGVAYVGYRSNDHWSGALTGLVALQLAKGGNLAAGAAGLGVLGAIGLVNIVPKEFFEKNGLVDRFAGFDFFRPIIKR